MEYCKGCIFYDEKYDEMLQSGDDVIVEGKPTEEKHYCRLYESNIPDGIVKGTKECKYFGAIKE